MHHGVWDASRASSCSAKTSPRRRNSSRPATPSSASSLLATVLSPRLKGVGRYYLVPDDGVAPIEQGAIVTQARAGNPLAARFMHFLESEARSAILVRNGFGLPRRRRRMTGLPPNCGPRSASRWSWPW